MKTAAFTLIETILYLALFNIIFFVVITWAISLAQNNRTAEYKNALEKNAIFVTSHLKDSFQEANSLDPANSTYNSDNGKVRVSKLASYKEYYLQNQVLKVTDGVNTHDLTDQFVHVTKFNVVPIQNALGTVTGANITVQFTAEKYPQLTKEIESYYAFR
ncbi:MAG: type II secretion system protein [Patescibacteria group bacterium]